MSQLLEIHGIGKLEELRDFLAFVGELAREVNKEVDLIDLQKLKNVYHGDYSIFLPLQAASFPIFISTLTAFRIPELELYGQTTELLIKAEDLRVKIQGVSPGGYEYIVHYTRAKKDFL